MQESAHFGYFGFAKNQIQPMSKSSHFSGQPLYSQVIKLLDKSKILQISRENGGERYTKRFNGWVHMVVMLYAVIMRFDSLREITASLLAESRKLCHLGISFKIGRSTLADANVRRPEAIFEAVYRDLYARYRHVLSSDSRSRRTPKWMKRLQIIDSTTITLFSNLLFKGVGRHSKAGRKKGGIKVQIWVTLIANLLLMVMQKGLTRKWNFSGLATMVRITLMYYVDFHSLFNNPDKDWENILSEASGSPPELSLFD